MSSQAGWTTARRWPSNHSRRAVSAHRAHVVTTNSALTAWRPPTALAAMAAWPSCALSHSAPSSALPVGLEPRDACLVEPLAAAVHGIRRGAITGTDRVAVVGAGSIGLCAVAAARATGVHVDLAARHDHQLAAGERLGAGRMVGEGYDIVVDAVGSTASLGQCVTIARPGGRIVLLGGNWDGLNIPDSEFILKENCIIPSVGYSRSGPSRDVDVARTSSPPCPR